jgi:hypothetical protein
LTSRTLERPTTCKFGAPTLTGGKSSNTKDQASLTSKTTKHLMFLVEQIKKVKPLLYMESMVRSTKDGELFILTKLIRFKRRDLTKILDGMSTDHSTWSQDFQ